MWYEEMTLRVLFLIAKILARRGEKVFPHEIDELEKRIFEGEVKSNGIDITNNL